MVVAAAAAAGTSPFQFLAQPLSIASRTSRCSLHPSTDSSPSVLPIYSAYGISNPRSGYLDCPGSFGRSCSNRKYQAGLKGPSTDGMLTSLADYTTVQAPELSKWRRSLPKSRKADTTLTTSSSKKRSFCPTAYSVLPSASIPMGLKIPLREGQGQGSCEEKWRTDWCHLNSSSSFVYQHGRDMHVFKSWRGRELHLCSALLEESGYIGALDPKPQDELYTHESESSSTKSPAGGFSVTGHPTIQQKLDITQQNSGRTGVVSFYTAGTQPSDETQVEPAPTTYNWWVSLLWLIGPTALVSSVVLPPLCLRKLFEVVLEDSLVTDFLILFFTETLFYVGVSIFLVVAHKVQQSTRGLTWRSESNLNLGYKVSSYVTMTLGVLLPIGTFAIVWPWTGPAAAAALFPYMAGLAVQFGFEQFIQERKSFVWPLIPVIFQVYRLHQLNRATQLVAGLLFSLRGAEATAETLAVNGSLQTLVTVLQLLGMLCLWALAAFLTHVLSSESQPMQSRVLPSAEVQQSPESQQALVHSFQ